MCESFSLTHICTQCQKTFLTPNLYKRQLIDGTVVYSFYKYSDIKDLLHTKHTDIGFYIYTTLANNSFKKFAQEFYSKEKYISIAIDDTIYSGYSHTAILNKQLSSHYIKPLFSILRAKNSVSYSGKSKKYRLLNPRNFQIKPFKAKEVILVDDIITTGATLIEAIKSLKQEGKEVLFCITLCDVSIK